MKQAFSEHFEKISKIFSCKSTCKADLLTEDKENQKPSINAQKNYCNQHIKPISYYCKSCKIFLCVLCCQKHSEIKEIAHEYIELQNMEGYTRQECQKILQEATKMHENIKNEEKFQFLPDYQMEFEEGVNNLENIKKQCINIVELFFSNITEDYLNLYKSLPCKFQKNSLEIALNSFIEKLEKTQEKNNANDTGSNKKKLKNIYEIIPEIKQFNEMQLDSELELLKKSFNVLLNFSSLSSKKPILPKISLNPTKNTLEAFLADYVTLIGPTENQYDQLKRLRITLPNYYNPQYENYLARIDSFNEQLILYNISNNTEEKVCLSAANSEEIPNNHALILTPNLEILIVGGRLKNGKATSNVFFCSPMSSSPEESESSELLLQKRASMNENRENHSLCYTNNTIFCLGGENETIGKLNSCEKYDLLQDRWDRIADMNLKRTSFGACSFNENFIYTFFGNEFIEKYDIQKNVWEILKPINYSPCFQCEKIACLQINPNQILMLGGSKEFENEEKMLSGYLKRGILYNVSENNLINLGEISSIPLKNASQIIIKDKNLYCLGEKEDDFGWKFDFEWVFKMKNGRGFEIIDMISYNN